MPVMTGIEMLDRLKSDAGLKNIPVIMLTAESARTTSSISSRKASKTTW